jgi:hypothetical protein
MKTPRLLAGAILSFCFFPCALCAQSSLKSQFMSLEEARPVLSGMSGSLPADLKGPATQDAAAWSAWVLKQDHQIRERLDRGEEDTLTNLLRFGVTFTKEYRIDDEYLPKYGSSSLVNAFAENRANDLIRAMASSNPNEGIAHMRAFLEKKGYSFKTPEDRKKIKKYLLDNLARLRDEYLHYLAQPKDDSRFQLFQQRGISLDTNLWPDYLIDEHLRHMAEQGLLKPGSVHRVAVVGPGLDFANKEKGNDFYPLQTIQPFAVLDSLFRLGLADPATVELYTLDISSDVNFHLDRARKNAAAGRSYTVQLPWDTSARHTSEYRSGFVNYWQKLGDHIGESVAPIAVPPGAAAETQTRAVKIRPAIVRRVTALDMNIVYQHLQPGAQPGFDLIIGTNIFVYFNAFEQSLARVNMSLMLNPGGFVLSNDKLPGTVPAGLADSLTTAQIVARDPDMTELMFCYQKKK